MSTLRATNIKHELSATNQIVLGADGSIGGTLGDTLAAKANTADIVAPGLVLVGSATITSTVSAVDIDNVFSATYDNYLITAHVLSDNSYGTRIQLRSSGTTSATAWNYIYDEVYPSSSAIGVATNQSAAIVNGTNTSWSNVSVGLFGPFLSRPTTFRSTSTRMGNSATPEIWDVSGGHNVSSSYDGIRFSLSTGNFTSGEFCIYGYRKGA